MSNPSILLSVLVLVLSCGQQEQVPQETAEVAEEVSEVQWIHDDFDAARDIAAREGKMVFIDFYADWCPPCRTLSDEYFPMPEYQSFFSGVVPLKVNVDNMQELAQQFGVSSIPTLVLTDASGNEVDRVVGITGNPQEFLEVLRSLGTD